MRTILILLFFSLSFAESDGRRAEGRVHEMSIVDMLGYAWKNLAAPERDAAPAIKDYFEAQHALSSMPRTENAEVKISFLGDIMWIRNGWEHFLSPEVRALLESSDGLIGNLETVISSIHPVSGFWPDRMRYNAPLSYLQNFESNNGSLFAALSTANNHTLDFGDEGALQTRAALAQLKIPQSGIHPSSTEKLWVNFERKGIRFGFYAATFGFNDSLSNNSKIHVNLLPGIAPEGKKPDLSEIRKVLEEMEKDKIQVKIISLHWGHEFEFYPTEAQMQIAHNIVALGADIILGSHPHVLQPDETCFVNGYEKQFTKVFDQSAMSTHHGCVLKDKTKRPRKARIFYSMGNFTTAMIPEYNRIAALKEIEFFHTTKGVDWNPPFTTLLYNEPASIFGPRRLVLLDSFLANCGPGFWKRACPRALLWERDFLRNFH